MISISCQIVELGDIYIFQPNYLPPAGRSLFSPALGSYSGETLRWSRFRGEIVDSDRNRAASCPVVILAYVSLGLFKAMLFNDLRIPGSSSWFPLPNLETGVTYIVVIYITIIVHIPPSWFHVCEPQPRAAGDETLEWFTYSHKWSGVVWLLVIGSYIGFGPRAPG